MTDWGSLVAPISKADRKSDINFGGTTWLVELIAPETTRIYNNVRPTHDPYFNPDSHIYYECDCGCILDPGTKSFASLNGHASEAGWKIRWRKDGSGYQPFCVKCGEGVE